MLGGSDTLDTFNTSGNNNGNNNKRLFMVPHFIRAQSPYKDVSIIMFISSHTHTLQIHVLLVMGWYKL